MKNNKLDITVIVPTRNEAANIRCCLDSLRPARRIVVLDSNSTDATDTMAASHGADVVPFQWNGRYPRKRQWALDHLDIDTEWVFLVDADESVPASLWDEIRSVINRGAAARTAYSTKKQFHFIGRCMRFGGFSHEAIIFFRAGTAHFEHLLDDVGERLDMEVHERLIVNGAVGRFHTPLIHRDRKPLADYIARHNAYSTWEAAVRHHFLQTGRYGEDIIVPRLFGNTQQRRRWLKKIAIRIPMEPQLWFFYHYIVRAAFLEGTRGLVAARIRRAYIEQVRAKMFELFAETVRETGLMQQERTSDRFAANDRNRVRLAWSGDGVSI